MDLFKLKQEQERLAKKISLKDEIKEIKTIAGTYCTPKGNELIACVALCSYPEMKLIETKTYTLYDPLPHKPGFLAYQQLPAIREAFNLLEKEADLLLIYGPGIAHPRKCGIATHAGLSLNLPTIGITEKLSFGKTNEKDIILHQEVVGFTFKTKEYGNPLYISPGYKISLLTAESILKNTIRLPHKLPEPLHFARKIAKQQKKNKILL